MDRKRRLDLGEDGDDAKRPAMVDPSSAAAAAAAAAPSVNPFTGRPYSDKYYEILDKRQGEYI
jgi:pre-mRNA-splicing factor ATP-dependent RNA helicase DHX15/PRP43